MLLATFAVPAAPFVNTPAPTDTLTVDPVRPSHASVYTVLVTATNAARAQFDAVTSASTKSALASLSAIVNTIPGAAELSPLLLIAVPTSSAAVTVACGAVTLTTENVLLATFAVPAAPFVNTPAPTDTLTVDPVRPSHASVYTVLVTATNAAPAQFDAVTSASTKSALASLSAIENTIPGAAELSPLLLIAVSTSSAAVTVACGAVTLTTENVLLATFAVPAAPFVNTPAPTDTLTVDPVRPSHASVYTVLVTATNAAPAQFDAVTSASTKSALASLSAIVNTIHGVAELSPLLLIAVPTSSAAVTVACGAVTLTTENVLLATFAVPAAPFVNTPAPTDTLTVDPVRPSHASVYTVLVTATNAAPAQFDAVTSASTKSALASLSAIVNTIPGAAELSPLLLIAVPTSSAAVTVACGAVTLTTENVLLATFAVPAAPFVNTPAPTDTLTVDPVRPSHASVYTVLVTATNAAPAQFDAVTSASTKSALASLSAIVNTIRNAAELSPLLLLLLIAVSTSSAAVTVACGAVTLTTENVLLATFVVPAAPFVNTPAPTDTLTVDPVRPSHASVYTVLVTATNAAPAQFDAVTSASTKSALASFSAIVNTIPGAAELSPLLLIAVPTSSAAVTVACGAVTLTTENVLLATFAVPAAPFVNTPAPTDTLTVDPVRPSHASVYTVLVTATNAAPAQFDAVTSASTKSALASLSAIVNTIPGAAELSPLLLIAVPTSSAAVTVACDAVTLTTENVLLATFAVPAAPFVNTPAPTDTLTVDPVRPSHASVYTVLVTATNAAPAQFDAVTSASTKSALASLSAIVNTIRDAAELSPLLLLLLIAVPTSSAAVTVACGAVTLTTENVLLATFAVPAAPFVNTPAPTDTLTVDPVRPSHASVYTVLVTDANAAPAQFDAVTSASTKSALASFSAIVNTIPGAAELSPLLLIAVPTSSAAVTVACGAVTLTTENVLLATFAVPAAPFVNTPAPTDTLTVDPVRPSHASVYTVLVTATNAAPAQFDAVTSASTKSALASLSVIVNTIPGAAKLSPLLLLLLIAVPTSSAAVTVACGAVTLTTENVLLATFAVPAPFVNTPAPTDTLTVDPVRPSHASVYTVLVTATNAAPAQFDAVTSASTKSALASLSVIVNTIPGAAKLSPLLLLLLIAVPTSSAAVTVACGAVTLTTENVLLATFAVPAAPFVNTPAPTDTLTVDPVRPSHASVYTVLVTATNAAPAQFDAVTSASTKSALASLSVIENTIPGAAELSPLLLIAVPTSSAAVTVACGAVTLTTENVLLATFAVPAAPFVNTPAPTDTLTVDPVRPSHASVYTVLVTATNTAPAQFDAVTSASTKSALASLSVIVNTIPGAAELSPLLLLLIAVPTSSAAVTVACGAVTLTTENVLLATFAVPAAPFVNTPAPTDTLTVDPVRPSHASVYTVLVTATNAARAQFDAVTSASTKSALASLSAIVNTIHGVTELSPLLLIAVPTSSAAVTVACGAVTLTTENVLLATFAVPAAFVNTPAPTDTLTVDPVRPSHASVYTVLVTDANAAPAQFR